MSQNKQGVARSTRRTTLTKPHARLWKAVVCGAVPFVGEDVASWYAGVQHALGTALHAADLARVTAECDAPTMHVYRAA